MNIIYLHHEHAAICSCRGDHHKIGVYFGRYNDLAIAFGDGSQAGRREREQEARQAEHFDCKLVNLDTGKQYWHLQNE